MYAIVPESVVCRYAPLPVAVGFFAVVELIVSVVGYHKRAAVCILLITASAPTFAVM
jgi:hypothetical protein